MLTLSLKLIVPVLSKLLPFENCRLLPAARFRLTVPSFCSREPENSFVPPVMLSASPLRNHEGGRTRTAQGATCPIHAAVCGEGRRAAERETAARYSRQTCHGAFTPIVEAATTFSAPPIVKRPYPRQRAAIQRDIAADRARLGRTQAGAAADRGCAPC